MTDSSAVIFLQATRKDDRPAERLAVERLYGVKPTRVIHHSVGNQSAGIEVALMPSNRMLQQIYQMPSGRVLIARPDFDELTKRRRELQRRAERSASDEDSIDFTSPRKEDHYWRLLDEHCRARHQVFNVSFAEVYGRIDRMMNPRTAPELIHRDGEGYDVYLRRMRNINTVAKYLDRTERERLIAAAILRERPQIVIMDEAMATPIAASPKAMAGGIEFKGYSIDTCVKDPSMHTASTNLRELPLSSVTMREIDHIITRLINDKASFGGAADAISGKIGHNRLLEDAPIDPQNNPAVAIRESLARRYRSFRRGRVTDWEAQGQPAFVGVRTQQRAMPENYAFQLHFCDMFAGKMEDIRGSASFKAVSHRPIFDPATGSIVRDDATGNQIDEFTLSIEYGRNAMHVLSAELARPGNSPATLKSAYECNALLQDDGTYAGHIYTRDDNVAYITGFCMTRASDAMGIATMMRRDPDFFKEGNKF